MTVKVTLSGRLVLDGYGKGHPANGNGAYDLALGEGSTAQDIMRTLGVPFDQVAIIKRNGHTCPAEAEVEDGDRIAFIAPDVASFWRYVGKQNLDMNTIVDF